MISHLIKLLWRPLVGLNHGNQFQGQVKCYRDDANIIVLQWDWSTARRNIPKERKAYNSGFYRSKGELNSFSIYDIIISIDI